MSDAFCRFRVGDGLTVMREMPDASVDLVLTSPPFLALRSYLPADHPDKAKEMGSEPTPGAYIDALLTIVEEARRVLAPYGSLCIELGDTFAGSGGAGGDYNDDGLREGQPKFRQMHPDHNKRHANSPTARVETRYSRHENGGPGWPLDKSLSLIPESLRWAMVYGRNPFTGRETPRWRVRNVVRWVRPNPPVGALGDKFRPATTEMVVACMSRERFFDLDAVRTPASNNSHGGGTWTTQGGPLASVGEIPKTIANPAGAPPLDWWQIPTEPVKLSHYATWPRDLCVVPIQAMCPRRVCVVCGEPSRRVVGEAEYVPSTNPGTNVSAKAKRSWDSGVANGAGAHTSKPDGGWVRQAPTLGWTDCACGCENCQGVMGDSHGTGYSRGGAVSSGVRDVPRSVGHCEHKWRAGVVLDPFAGSGTTLAVAQGHGRSAIGIDLDPRNLELARSRIGMFLTVEGDEVPRPVTDAPASLLSGESLGGRGDDAP